MKGNSTLENYKAIRNSAKNLSSSMKLIDYLLLALIFTFFVVPIAGLSLHYYKFGIPSRLLGLISYLVIIVKEFFGWI